jgi:hypothetical protein
MALSVLKKIVTVRGVFCLVVYLWMTTVRLACFALVLYGSMSVFKLRHPNHPNTQLWRLVWTA